MKSKKRIVYILLFCIACVSFFAVLHFKTRDVVANGTIAIIANGQTMPSEVSKLQLTKVTGRVTKGNNHIENISGDGILLSDVIASVGVSDYEAIRVISRDEYSATLTADEIKDSDVAYILLDEGKYRLYVFGDKNSKRNVADVVEIKVEE